MSGDETAGVAVSEDGELTSVFKCHGSKIQIDDLIEAAVEVGANKLSCFDIDGFLPNLYLRHGFKPAVRLRFDPVQAPLQWPSRYLRENFGEQYTHPDIAFSIYDEEGALTDRITLTMSSGRHFSKQHLGKRRYHYSLRNSRPSVNFHPSPESAAAPGSRWAHRQLRRDFAFAHDKDSVTHTEDFG